MAKLYFRYSAMNAGKSTALLQVAYNYEENDREVLLYTAAIDDRFGVGKITSRLGISRDAKIFNSEFSFLTELTTYLKDHAELPSCILVDEAQFMTEEQVRELHYIASVEGVPVICYGLRSDFQGKPFPGSAALLTLADSLEETKTICNCGKKATMNIRVNTKGERVVEGQQVEIGDKVYRQVCAKCFYTLPIEISDND